MSQKIQDKYKKPSVVDVKSGDNVKVHQRIVEGGKERIQIFDGLVIRVSRRGSLSQNFTVRRIASGIGVEKTFLIHSPSIIKIEITKRSKVRRNYLTYMRGLTGKSTRLSGVDFDRDAVNKIDEPIPAEKGSAAEAELTEEPVESEQDAKSQSDKVQNEINEAAESQADKLEEKPVERPAGKTPAQDQNKQK